MRSKKRAIELHRKLWDWLYHHPSKDKDDWPRWIHNGGDINGDGVVSLCFLCEYSRHTGTGCRGCPLDWEITKYCVWNGYFDRYSRVSSPKTRKKYAALIRDLREKKK